MFFRSCFLRKFAVPIRHFLVWLVLAFNFFGGHHAFANDRAHIAYDADLYLVPIGPVPREALESFASYFRELVNFKVEITAPLPLPDRTVDPQRKQLIAEQVNDVMARIFGPTLHKSTALVIGITANDMYIATMNWRFAYSHGNGQYAVVSAAHMGDGISNNEYWSPLVILRMQKMLNKRVAIQSLGIGSRIPLPPVLNKPILSLEDLDQLDAKVLSQSLATASRLFTPQHNDPAPYDANKREASSDEKILLQILLLIAILILAGACLYWILKRHAHKAQATWQAFAQVRGWRYTEGKKRWYGAPFSIEGQIDEIPFVISWYQEGSGRNTRIKTRFTGEFTSPYHLVITPILSIFVFLFSHDRAKTGDRLYDCNFSLQSVGTTPPISVALRNKHLTMPATVSISNEQIHLTYDGNANPAETELLLDLAKDWLSALRSTAPRVDTQTQRAMVSVFLCWFSRFAEPLFWLFSITSVALIILLLKDGNEETSLPWMISWDFLWPAAIGLGSLWLAIRWYRRKLQSRFFADTATVFIALIYVWGLSGVWVLAWNAKVGPQLDMLVVGAVTDKNASNGKGGPSYSMSLKDIETRREVKINVNQVTYESLRLGDPVAFEIKKGSLGIYYFTR